ncbi:MAG TPA: DUF1592 domain-containing protein, partial [Polyangiaceae bacterium]|nr:DUF1592 domain-containing protein [Polyangiaceae bacterium]
ETGGSAQPNAGTGSGVSQGGSGNSSNGGGANPSGGKSNPGGGSGSTAGSPPMTSGGSTPLPSGVEPSEMIPQRIRRLANAEFDASLKNLTGTDKAPAQSFAPDARQSGFTLNDAQRVDNVTAKQIYAAASDAASSFDVTKNAPCQDTSKAEACAQSFIASYGAKAYRRPLTTEESAGLLAVYKTGADGATYADGIRLVVRALVNSAGFLYLTEIGNAGVAAPGTAAALTPYELASSLSFLVTNAPPSEQLVADAVAGKLDTPEGRGKAFDDLVRTPAARDRIVRVVREWVGVDRISETDKDSNIYPNFAGLKAAMVTESQQFVENVLTGTGTVGELLGANWTMVTDTKLAQLYNANGSGRVTLPTRRGILNQAAWLSVFAHAHESSPVLRGVDIARRFACLNIASPTTLNIAVVPPPPDPSKTTRARFSTHSTDSICAGCHKNIDQFGFAFEEYDGMGTFRTKEGSNDVNSKVTINSGTDFDGDYADGNALAVAMSKSPQVTACFARHMFRGSAARSDDTVQASEDAFIRYWQSLPMDQQGNILQTLATFVKSPLFTHRRAP